MQKDIYNDADHRNLTEEFSKRLRELESKGLLRHALAAMAFAMQQELTSDCRRGKIAHSQPLELIMRGVFTTLTGDGSRSPHPEQKISGGYICLMADLQEDRREEICNAFDVFQKVLYGK